MKLLDRKKAQGSFTTIDFAELDISQVTLESLR